MMPDDGPDQASDDHVIKDHVIAAGDELAEAVGISRLSVVHVEAVASTCSVAAVVKSDLPRPWRRRGSPEPVA